MTPEREHMLRLVWMAMASDLASMSLATRSKVGAIIVKDGNVASCGWNGMPSGFPNEELEYFEDAGLVGSKLVTNPLVLHAESNAILKCAKSGRGTDGAEMYVTMSPCPDCAKLIIQAGIKHVYYRDQYRLTEGLDVLRRANIEVTQLNAEEVRNVHD
jgi:dCMP deaminase